MATCTRTLSVAEVKIGELSVESRTRGSNHVLKRSDVSLCPFQLVPDLLRHSLILSGHSGVRF